MLDIVSYLVSRPMTLCNPKHLHHLIPQVIDNLHRKGPATRTASQVRHVLEHNYMISLETGSKMQTTKWVWPSLLGLAV